MKCHSTKSHFLCWCQKISPEVHVCATFLSDYIISEDALKKLSFMRCKQTLCRDSQCCTFLAHHCMAISTIKNCVTFNQWPQIQLLWAKWYRLAHRFPCSSIFSLIGEFLTLDSRFYAKLYPIVHISPAELMSVKLVFLQVCELSQGIPDWKSDITAQSEHKKILTVKPVEAS